MAEFRPEVLNEDEVEQLLTQVTEEEVVRARELSLTPLKEQILFEGEPGCAVVCDSTAKEYIDCTALTSSWRWPRTSPPPSMTSNLHSPCPAEGLLLRWCLR